MSMLIFIPYTYTLEVNVYNVYSLRIHSWGSLLLFLSCETLAMGPGLERELSKSQHAMCRQILKYYAKFLSLV